MIMSDVVKMEEGDDEWEDVEENKTYIPGQPLDKDEVLVCDDSAYVMYHKLFTGAPCLSFDIIKDWLGENRTDYPMTCYVVAGTQAADSSTNNIIVLKLSNMNANKAIKESEEDEDESSESEDEDEKPVLESALIKHQGCVNRIRATRVGDKMLAASWSEKGRVHIWDLSRPILAVDDPAVIATYSKNEESTPPVFTSKRHTTEGFAMDWSPLVSDMLATGDCHSKIFVWKRGEGGTWNIDKHPFIAHTDSVEEIQWSPTEQNVFASCSVDRSIRIWDARATPKKACMLTKRDAHESDVNVMSWNRTQPFIVSGGDDATINVWDLRELKDSGPVASFKHHTAPITSVEWHPDDNTVFVASGSDDQVTLWDLAVEREQDVQDIQEIPPQLLFIHQGQQDIKEVHWHSQCPGVVISTAHSGFNVFKTISV